MPFQPRNFRLLLCMVSAGECCAITVLAGISQCSGRAASITRYVRMVHVRCIHACTDEQLFLCFASFWRLSYDVFIVTWSCWCVRAVIISRLQEIELWSSAEGHFGAIWGNQLKNGGLAMVGLKWHIKGFSADYR